MLGLARGRQDYSITKPWSVPYYSLLFAIIRYYSLLFAEELQSERPLLVIKIERQWTDLIGKYGSASAVPRDEIFTARASCKTIFGKTA